MNPRAKLKCPRCGAATAVHATRLFRRTLIRRVRECEAGHRFSTYEVTAALLSERVQADTGRAVA